VIVISGALVLVALVLLVLGLTMQDLTFVYGSIGVSLVSFVFLVIGILQRRGEQPQPASAAADVRDDSAPAPQAEPVPVPAARTAARRSSASRQEVLQDSEDAPQATEHAQAAGTVLIVPGRPRYHVEGCRYLSGKQVDEVDVLDARGDGFTACGVCKPDAVLEALTAEPVAEIVLVGEQEPDTGVPGTQDEVQQVPVPVRSRGSRRVSEVPAAAPRARKAAAKTAAAPAATAVASESDAPTKPRRAGRVVVIPDRGRFHTAECRFVRGVAGTEELTKAQAARAGYQPCGVCKPA
jgi:hypothetical protein